MANLKSQLTGVKQDSPPADTEPAATIEPDKNKTGEKDKKGEDRTIENVRGELLRKLDQFQTNMMNQTTQFAEKFGRLESMLEGKGTPKPNTNADSLDNYSVQQLENHRSTIAEENKAAFEAYLTDRKVHEGVAEQLSAFKSQQLLDQERSKYGNIAAARFPEITDSASKFAMAVDAEIRSMDESQVLSNPRIVLDVANEIAHAQGLKPQARRAVQGITRPAPVGTSPANTEKPSGLLTSEEREAIAARLKYALPKHKRKDGFNMDNIVEKEEFYRSDRNFGKDGDE